VPREGRLSRQTECLPQELITGAAAPRHITENSSLGRTRRRAGASHYWRLVMKPKGERNSSVSNSDRLYDPDKNAPIQVSAASLSSAVCDLRAQRDPLLDHPPFRRLLRCGVIGPCGSGRLSTHRLSLRCPECASVALDSDPRLDASLARMPPAWAARSGAAGLPLLGRECQCDGKMRTPSRKHSCNEEVEPAGDAARSRSFGS
jgi:hypothetical protein